MATSEIEKLERRYAENPQGLTFAPLAEVHRKNGDVARALELLRAGLELHPNYIPASIVLGRCHWDLGDLPAAESAFAHVLRLDDENVIALKSLADINERLERFAEAQRWLHRLVSVDRSNEEARQQLARLETAKAQGGRALESTAEPGAPTDLPQEVAALEPEPPVAAAPPERSPAELAPLDLTAAIAEPPSRPEASELPSQKVEAESSTLEFLDTSEPGRPPEAEKPPPPEEPAAVAGLISQEFVPPKENTYRLHPELTQELVSAKEPPDRLDVEALDVETMEEVELRSSGAVEFRVPNAAEDFLDLAAAPASAPRIEDSPGPKGPEPIPAGPDLVPAETADQVGKPSYSVRDTKGQSVASFFEALLAARPPGNSGSAASPSSSPAQSGAPTRPAQDALSLGSVFGEESLPIPPAVPAAGQAKDAAVSFDDFFGSPAGGSSPLPPGSADPRNDDLDQFQSWLQNLKR